MPVERAISQRRCGMPLLDRFVFPFVQKHECSEPHIGTQTKNKATGPVRIAFDGVEILDRRLHHQPGFNLRAVIEGIRLLPPERISKEQVVELAVGVAVRVETNPNEISSTVRRGMMPWYTPPAVSIEFCWFVEFGLLSYAKVTSSPRFDPATAR